ncbi:MAG TPA: DUF523 domain-containing protein [Nitrospirota bacterium]
MPNRIKLAISSCLLGNNVRYDGGNKRDNDILDAFVQIAEWVPVCPETESGMPVPREPMQLVGDIVKPRLLAIETKIDVTDVLMRWTEERLDRLKEEGVCGFVFKARSPSCGVRDAPRIGPGGVKQGAGLFAGAVMRRYPLIPVEDEAGLRDPSLRERFLERVSAYCRSFN